MTYLSVLHHWYLRLPEEMLPGGERADTGVDCQLAEARTDYSGVGSGAGIGWRNWQCH